jgi:hypothetical protein
MLIIVTTRAASPLGGDLTTYTFSSVLQKVEARGAKVFAPIWLPKVIRGLAVWAKWHDDPKTERD